MKFINSLGDKMLSRVLKQDTAGACVPENGSSCGDAWVGSYCLNNVQYNKYCKGYYNCSGQCTASSSGCYSRPVGGGRC